MHFNLCSVHMQAVNAKMLKEGMKTEAKHVKKLVSLTVHYLIIPQITQNSQSKELKENNKNENNKIITCRKLICCSVM